MSSIIKAIRTHIKSCPLLEGERVNVNYIGTEMSYSTEPPPCDPIITPYVDGGSKRQFQFAFISKEEYDEDVQVAIENSGFCQEFEDWLELQNMLDILPELPGKRSPVKYETLSKGYLYDVDGNKGKYYIECRLIYTQEV